ncbi:hypothetical protein V2J09_007636 [Rumex salicifolius]
MPAQIAAAAAGENNEHTVVVGVKLDSLSKELLTWSLVKVAKPGDRVIALHVMGNNEILDSNGKSSLLSVVGNFDSVLAVYEGFCNLKQVDLKLKICRGSSVRKILIREAQSYSANKLILGTSKHHTIRSSTCAAKYCAKKLSKDCAVLAVHNGKIVFHREASPSTARINTSQVANEHRRNTLLSLLNQSANASFDPSNGKHEELEKVLIKTSSDCGKFVLKKNCDVCTTENFHTKEKIDKPGNDCGKSMACDSASVEIKQGWPLLKKNRRDSNPLLLRQNSVVQWAMQLPRRYVESTDNPNLTQQSCYDEDDGISDLDGEYGAIVPVGDKILSKSQEHDSTSLPLEFDGLHKKYSSTCRIFKYHELQSATSNFAPENLIGKGGSSRVYRGCLPNGKELAVKILRHTEDVMKEFALEIEIITSLHHKNVISLYGFCFEDSNLLMVYDLLPRGSLEENLHGLSKKDQRAFGWNERYKVALGIAEALHYLHSQCNKSVIHRDVKSSNILLSDDFEPQLSDFGLAKWASSSGQKSFSDVAGTFGYLAPEYFMYGKVTDKIDVYAYGVVLLELLSGRKPISNDHPKGQESLVIWRMVLAANLCIRRSPRHRPNMSLVLKLLQGDGETIKWARMQVNTTDNSDRLHGPRYTGPSSIQGHLNLALLDVEDDSVSFSSIEQNVSLEDYLRGRWSRSSSFD